MVIMKSQSFRLLLLSFLIITIPTTFACKGESTDIAIPSVPSTDISYSKADSITAAIMAGCTARAFVENFIAEHNGKIVPHIVDRGETWSSLANLSGVEQNMILALNPFNTECLTGTEVYIVELPKPSYEDLCNANIARLLQQGMDMENNGKFRDAIKIYSNIIKDYDALEAYYLRGRAYYRSNKLKESTRDFSHVVNFDTKHKFPDAIDIYQQVSEEWETRKEAKKERILGIVATALQAGTQIAGAYFNSKYGTSQSNLYLSGSNNGLVSSIIPNVTAEQPFYNIGVETNYYQNGIQWPAELNPLNYFTPDAMEVKVTYDKFGTPMYSMPGVANAVYNMQNDFNGLMGYNYLNSPSYGETQLIQNEINNMFAQQIINSAATPMYGVDYTNFDNDGTILTANSDYSADTSGSSRRCIYCEGTGFKQISQRGVATFGYQLAKKQCPTCKAIWNPETETHTCVKCTHCDYWKNR